MVTTTAGIPEFKDLEAFRAAAAEFDAMVASWGATPEDLVREFEESRRADRERKRTDRVSADSTAARLARPD